MIKITIKLVLFIFVFLFIGASFYVLAPLEKLYEVRATNKIENIRAKYINITGESNCAKLYEVFDKSEKAVFSAYPDGVPAIEETSLAYSDNVFNIKGYRYHWIRENKLTGKKEITKSHRIDVSAWAVETPYTLWSDNFDKDGLRLAVKSEVSVMYMFEGDSNNAELYRKENFVDCLLD